MSLPNIQVLRGVAALMVVVYHASGNVADWHGGQQWDAGQAGVDIFFVISGLVMALSAAKPENRNWKAFAIRRLARIAPMYWLATSVKFAGVLAAAFLLHESIDWWHAAASYAFIPAHWGSGPIYPLLFVGWTLNFEMFFYAIFTIALASRMSVVRFLTAAIIILAVIGLYRQPEWPAASTLLHPILLEFLMGVWIGRFVRADLRIPPVAAMSLIVLSSMFIIVAPVDMNVSWSRVVWWGLPGAVLVGVCAHIETSPKRLWIVIADASFAIYLWHCFVISAADKALHAMSPSMVTGAAWLVATVALCTAAGYAMHRLVELKLTACLKQPINRLIARLTPRRIDTTKLAGRAHAK